MYKLTNENYIYNSEANVWFPNEESNYYYQKYQAWLAEGNLPEPADPPPPPDYSALRRAAYTTESDPLFFMEQRQEVPVGTWLAKVTEIKARWPQD